MGIAPFHPRSRSFNPRLPGGRRRAKTRSLIAVCAFQSTPSGGKATGGERGVPSDTRVSIHAFRGEGDEPRRALRRVWSVSIHAFRGEGDRRDRERSPEPVVVSIHAFRGEGDGRPHAWHNGFAFQSTPSGGKATCSSQDDPMGSPVFQSTPSGGKATRAYHEFDDSLLCFNPRLPGGRRRAVQTAGVTAAKFQSTPSGGKATRSVGCRLPPALFQSTPSGGKATVGTRPDVPGMRRFNPRLPGGRRRVRSDQRRNGRVFQSTPSGGKATGMDGRSTFDRAVSIHAFRGEGDPPRQRSGRRCHCFNPRLPGGRRPRTSRARRTSRVSIHAFRGEGDLRPWRTRWRIPTVSIHAFRGEGDHPCGMRSPGASAFQSTPSGGKATTRSA